MAFHISKRHSLYHNQNDYLNIFEYWEILKANNPVKDPSKRTRRDIPLRGIIKCGHCGCPMMPSYAKKKGVTYYYYLCENHEKSTGLSECPVKKVPAGMVEQLVQEQLDKVFHSHDVLVELSRIDINLHNPRLRSEIARLGYDTVREPCTDDYQKIAVIDRHIRQLCPMHSNHAGKAW